MYQRALDVTDLNHAQLRRFVQDSNSAILHLKQPTRKSSSCSKEGKEAAINTLEKYVIV